MISPALLTAISFAARTYILQVKLERFILQNEYDLICFPPGCLPQAGTDKTATREYYKCNLLNLSIT